MIIETHHRLSTALALKRQSMTDEAQTPLDVCILSPDYPSWPIDDYIPPSPPLIQASLACLECPR